MPRTPGTRMVGFEVVLAPGDELRLAVELPGGKGAPAAVVPLFELAGSGGTDALVRALGASAAGLLFLLGWELLIHLPGRLPRLTVTAHLRALAGTAGPPDLTAAMAALILAALSVACLAAAVAVFKHGEYLPEP